MEPKRWYLTSRLPIGWYPYILTLFRLARTSTVGMNMCQSLRTEPRRWWTTSRFPIGWYILIPVSDWLGQALWVWICVRVWGRSQEDGGLHHVFLLVDPFWSLFLLGQALRGWIRVRVWGRSQEDGGLHHGFLLVDSFWSLFLTG